MLTRHFYSVEDASAALQYAIHNKKPYEAVYWAKELSEYRDQLQKTLFMSWFYSIGIDDISFIQSIKNPTLESVFQMSSSESRNSTLFYMFLNGALHKEYSTKKSLIKLSSSLIQSNKDIDLWIRNTLFNRYLESWQSSLKVWDDDSFIPIIHQFILTKFDNPTSILNTFESIYELESVDIVYRRCAIIGILCMNDSQMNTSLCAPVPSDLGLYLEYWKSVYGQRRGRIYPLPNECFYGKTKRGRMKRDETNIQELYDPISLVKNQTIYKKILGTFETFKAFQNDSAQYDMFFNYYFCDDIPDEWSLEDQQKSHGNGILEKDETPSLEKYLSSWIDPKAKNYTGCGTSIVEEYCKKYKDLTYDFEENILKNYSSSSNRFNLKTLHNELDKV